MSRACPVCGAGMAARKVWILRCPSCGFLCSTLTPGTGTGVDGLETLRRSNFAALLDRLEKYASLKDKTGLEVGCSAGLFLEAAVARGMNIEGLEPEKEKARLARDKGFSVTEGLFPEALPAGKKFDFIFFNDVFEHLPEPVTALKTCEKLLNPSGMLVLNLPDSGGFLYRLADVMDCCGCLSPLERLWQKGFSSPHISYFNHKNLRRMAEKETGLSLVYAGRLRSMELSGLKERIGRSPAAFLTYAGLLPVVFLQDFLSADIALQFYRAG